MTVYGHNRPGHHKVNTMRLREYSTDKVLVKYKLNRLESSHPGSHLHIVHEFIY